MYWHFLLDYVLYFLSLPYDDLKTDDDFKNKDNLKNEDDLKSKGDLRNKNDHKIEDNLILKTFHCHSLLMILRS